MQAQTIAFITMGIVQNPSITKKANNKKTNTHKHPKVSGSHVNAGTLAAGKVAPVDELAISY